MSITTYIGESVTTVPQEIGRKESDLNQREKLESFAEEYNIPYIQDLLETHDYYGIINTISNTAPDNISKIKFLSLLYSYLLTEMKNSRKKINIKERISMIIKSKLIAGGEVGDSRLEIVREIERIAILYAEKITTRILYSIRTNNTAEMWSYSVELFELLNDYFCDSPERIFQIHEKTLRKVVKNYGNIYLSTVQEKRSQEDEKSLQKERTMRLVEAYKGDMNSGDRQSQFTSQSEEGNSTMFYTSGGGEYVNTLTGMSSFMPENIYPSIIVNGKNLNYELRRKVFDGHLVEAVEDILSSQQNGVHPIQILGDLYSRVSKISIDTPETTIRESVLAAEPTTMKAKRVARTQLSKILRTQLPNESSREIEVTTIDSLDTARELIRIAVKKYTSVLTKMLSESADINVALKLYTMIFNWCENLPAHIFTQEIRVLKLFLRKNKIDILDINEDDKKKGMLESMLANHLLRRD